MRLIRDRFSFHRQRQQRAFSLSHTHTASGFHRLLRKTTYMHACTHAHTHTPHVRWSETSQRLRGRKTQSSDSSTAKKSTLPSVDLAFIYSVFTAVGEPGLCTGSTGSAGSAGSAGSTGSTGSAGRAGVCPSRPHVCESWYRTSATRALMAAGSSGSTRSSFSSPLNCSFSSSSRSRLVDSMRSSSTFQ